MSNSKFDEWAFDQTVTKGGAIFGCKDRSGVNVGFVNTGTGEYFSLSEWISVEDRLPKQSDRVLISTLDWDLDPITSVATFNEGKVGFLVAGGIKDKDVTHWQPLPAPK